MQGQRKSIREFIVDAVIKAVSPSSPAPSTTEAISTTTGHGEVVN